MGLVIPVVHSREEVRRLRDFLENLDEPAHEHGVTNPADRPDIVFKVGLDRPIRVVPRVFVSRIVEAEFFLPVEGMKRLVVTSQGGNEKKD
ncbi:MAG: hypothetical protein AVO33_02265 [delta proteobacterium ML8_F1]|nr:MAG: hypothetical protein AVO33_02265 [delta proteobacterium ML8_F1]